MIHTLKFQLFVHFLINIFYLFFFNRIEKLLTMRAWFKVNRDSLVDMEV